MKMGVKLRYKPSKEGKFVEVTIAEFRQTAISVPPNTLARSRNEMSRLFRSIIRIGGLEWDKSTGKSIKVRAERYINLLMYESKSERDFLEKVEGLEKDFVKFAEVILIMYESESEQEFFQKLTEIEQDFEQSTERAINRWNFIRRIIERNGVDSGAIQKALEYVCCVLQLDFQFLCSTVKCE